MDYTKQASAKMNFGLGDSGPGVKAFQYILQKAGYKLAADGIFGPETLGAVKVFQSDNSFPVTGIVTPDLIQTMTDAATSYATGGASVTIGAPTFETPPGAPGSAVPGVMSGIGKAVLLAGGLWGLSKIFLK